MRECAREGFTGPDASNIRSLWVQTFGAGTNFRDFSAHLRIA